MKAYKNRLIFTGKSLKPRKIHFTKSICDLLIEPRVVVYYYEKDHLEDWPLDIYQNAKKFLRDIKVIYIGEL